MIRLHPAHWSVRTWVIVTIAVGTIGLFGGH